MKNEFYLIWNRGTILSKTTEAAGGYSIHGKRGWEDGQRDNAASL